MYIVPLTKKKKTMEEIEFSCVSCRSALCASKTDVGELVQCPSCNHTMKVPRYGVVAGMKLGDFKVLKCLGVGGMGEVWLAEQESLQRRVALKILSPDISNDESFINRFNQEVKIAGKLIHPHIVVAFQAGEQNGIRYLTCAYVDGMVASEYLETNGPMDEAEVLRIGRDIAKGLKYAWEKAHILHRDVKPDNIMISKDGTPMLMDMGISKNFDEDVSLTMTGEIIGTPNYISPEQAHAADDIDSRSDQYSLGATLYHLLTGMLPYNSTSAMGILAQHLQNPVPDARKSRPEISVACSKLLQKMMAKKPEGRYQSWDEFIVAANSLLPPEMRDGTMLPGTLKASGTSNKKAMLTGSLIAVIVFCLLISAFITHRWLNRKENRGQKIVHSPSIITNSVLPEVKNKEPEPIESGKPEIKETPQVADKVDARPPVNGLSESGKPEKGPDNIRDRLKAQAKKRLTQTLQKPFDATEAQAAAVADKWIEFHSEKRKLVNSELTEAERKKKLEPLKRDLKNTVEEQFGKSAWLKFDKFMRNDISIGRKQPKRPFGGGRRRH
jgi:serine/threonine protein kinase/DNA-directed RNA polymerase subunit RPC12/RpoP